jgi:Na+(H+)/acetate symporter ActP
VLSQDLLPAGRRGDRLRGSVRGFRLAASLTGAGALALALPAASLPLTQVVGLAFAVAASTFCPLLVLGIWWRGLTAPGAAAGLLAGGGLSAVAIGSTLTGAVAGGWPQALLAQPAAWTVPTAFVVMIVVSRLTAHAVPADVGRTMLVLHAPDGLGLQPIGNRSSRPTTVHRSRQAGRRTRG